jgi:hypothetical protein
VILKVKNLADELTIAVAMLFGAVATYFFLEYRKKIWYLETMDPRQHYEIGKESKIIAHMEVGGRHFNGIKAGKYQILLLYGDVSTFSKPVLSGKIEEMYLKVLTKSLVGKGFVTKLEKLRFLEFIHKHIPSLSVKAYMITGELISPQEVLDLYWEGDARTDVMVEMKRRGLIDPKVLWIKPYPPEDKLKEILTGTLMVPDIILNHEEEYTRVTASQRETLIKMDSGIAKLLREVIVLERDIITSVSDPVHVIGMIVADRARKIEGLGLEQLAEKGGMMSVVQAARVVKQYRDELTKALSEEVKPDEIARIEQKLRKVEELERRMDELTKMLGKPAMAEAKAAEK